MITVQVVTAHISPIAKSQIIQREWKILYRERNHDVLCLTRLQTTFFFSDKLHTFSVRGSLLCQLLEFRFSRQNGLWVVMNKKQGKVSHFEYYFLSS